MIDIHSHILPYMDDGCYDINDSIESLEKAYESGITKIIATPHFLQGQFENYKSDVLKGLANLKNSIDESVVSVTSGSEIMVFPEIVDLLKRGSLCTLNNSRYVLIEFPLDVRVPNVLKLIDDILVAGFVPVIAHPERYAYVQRDVNEAIRYVEAGALLQLNITSLIGNYGNEAKDTGIKLIKHNLIHFWGSDFHTYREIYDDNKIKDSLDILRKIVDTEKFIQITEVNPECVLLDKEIKIFDIKYKLGLFG